MNNDVKLFKALGEETRYKIIEVLLQGEICACEIPKLINRTQSNTSMHLAKLNDLGIIQFRKDGKMVIYSIKDKRVCDVFKALENLQGKIQSPCCCIEKKKI
ncbi:MAG: ArsR/SmtB family transcription factor [Nanoarchaeota archaeon]